MKVIEKINKKIYVAKFVSASFIFGNTCKNASSCYHNV